MVKKEDLDTPDRRLKQSSILSNKNKDSLRENLFDQVYRLSSKKAGGAA